LREQFELYILGEKKTKMLILFVFIWSLILFLDLFIFDYSLLLILMNILFIDILIKCNKNNYWIIRQDSIEIICIENILTFIKFIFFQKKVIVLFKDIDQIKIVRRDKYLVLVLQVNNKHYNLKIFNNSSCCFTIFSLSNGSLKYIDRSPLFLNYYNQLSFI